MDLRKLEPDAASPPDFITEPGMAIPSSRSLPGITEHRITTPHGTVAVVDYGGDGPDVLLLHGGGRTLADWELVRPHRRT